MSYELRGSLLEVCTCDVNCECCWSRDEPSGESCDRVVAWKIDSGVVDGVDLSGITLAMLGLIDQQGAPVKSMIFLPEHVTDAQAEALVAVWSGKKGGPMADLANMLGEIVGVERTSIEYRDGGHLTIGTRITADVPNGAEGVLVAATGYRADVPELGAAFEVSGQRAVHGVFHFAC
jgi:hypothetical protein